MHYMLRCTARIRNIPNISRNTDRYCDETTHRIRSYMFAVPNILMIPLLCGRQIMYINQPRAKRKKNCNKKGTQ